MTEKEIYSVRVKPQWGEPDKTRHVRHTAVTRKLAFREMPPTSASHIVRLQRIGKKSGPLRCLFLSRTAHSNRKGLFDRNVK